jgi:CRP-like cAMP-binding protein
LVPPPVFDADEEAELGENTSKVKTDICQDELTETPTTRRRSWKPKRVIDADTFRKQNEEEQQEINHLAVESFHEDLAPSAHRRSWRPKRVLDAETYLKENNTVCSEDSTVDSEANETPSGSRRCSYKTKRVVDLQTFQKENSTAVSDNSIADDNVPETPSGTKRRSWKPKRVVDAETYQKEREASKSPGKTKKKDSTRKQKQRGRLPTFEVDESDHTNNTDLSAASTGLDGRVQRRRSKSASSLKQSKTIHVTRLRNNRGVRKKKIVKRLETGDDDDETASTTPIDIDDLPVESFHCGGDSDNDFENDPRSNRSKPKQKAYKVKRVVDAERYERESELDIVLPPQIATNCSIATKVLMQKSSKIAGTGTEHGPEDSPEIIEATSAVPNFKDRIGMFSKHKTRPGFVEQVSFLSAKHMEQLVPIAKPGSSESGKGSKLDFKPPISPTKNGKCLPTKTLIKRGIAPRQPSIKDLLPPPKQSLDAKNDEFVRKKIQKTNSINRSGKLRRNKSALLAQKSVSKKDVFLGITAKPVEDLSNFKLPEFPKDSESIQIIKSALRGNFVFDMKHEELDNFVKAFEQVVVRQGDVIIKQGDAGDYFYVVAYGTVSFHVNGRKVGSIGQGKSFGEMSLLYTCPRAATAIAEKSSTRLFRVDQKSFRFVMHNKTKESQEKKEKLLRDIPFLEHLSDGDLHRLSSVMTPCLFQTGDYIVKQGERGDSFYIIQDGKVRVTDIVVGNISYEDVNLEPGDYFGEGALISSERRAASVVAMTKGTAFSIDRPTFQKVMGDFVTLISKAQDRHKLEGIKIFRDSNLTAKHYEQLASQLIDKDFKGNKAIFEEGELVDGTLYLVREGNVLISTTDGSRSEEIAPGGYFGQEQLLADTESGQRYAQYTAKASADGCVCGVLLLEVCRSVFNTKKMENGLHAGGSAYKQKKRLSMVGDIGKTLSLNDLKKELVLGEGQYAEVWLASAKTNKSKQKYALKVQSQDANKGEENAVEAFQREIMVLQQLHHPFIIDIIKSFDVGDGFLYMLMEVVEGGELWSRIHREENGEWISGMNEDSAKFYTLAIADALAYIHREKFVFRDLKPENVLLGNDGYPKIVDFGFSTYCPDKTYTFCGTPNYLAPEVVKNQGHGIGVDHWALGVVCYECLTGENPFYFEDMDQIALFQAIVQEDFYPLPENSNPDMVNFITSLLEKEPAQRLGVLAGQESDILRHKWFANLDLEKVRTKEAVAPWKPRKP